MAMGAPGGSNARYFISPPEKGSFPQDHFQECTTQVNEYNHCMKKYKNISAYCQDLARAYLQCRMDHDLMAKEDLDAQGFSRKQVPIVELDKNKRIYTKYERDPSKPYIAGLSRIRPRNGSSRYSDE